MKSIKLFVTLLILLTIATTASAYNFTRDLELGARGEDVAKLQEMLVSAGTLANDSVTGYFGPATELAVAKWQIAKDIKPISGIFGAISRAIVASVPVANLSTSPVIMPSPSLSLQQAKEAVLKLIDAKLLKQKNYERALDVIYRDIVMPEPFVRVISPNGGEVISNFGLNSNKVSWEGNGLSSVVAYLIEANEKEPFGIIGGMSEESMNLHGKAIYWDGKTVVNSLHNGEPIAVPDGDYKIYLVGSVKGVSNRSVSDTSDKTFTIKQNNVKPDMKLKLSVVENGQTADGYSQYRLSAPNDYGIMGWKILFDCDNNVELNAIAGAECGEYTFTSTNGKVLDFRFNVKTSILRKEKEINAFVWGYTKYASDSRKPVKNEDLVAFGRLAFNVGPGYIVTPVTPIPVTPVTPVVTPTTPVVTPTKLTAAQICAVVQKPTTSTCVKSYPIFKGTEKMTGYMYNGFKYDISYSKYANSAGAVCRDTCTAIAK